jgi:predicted transcriptional regulator
MAYDVGMDKKQLIEKAGNQAKLAALLGISQAAVSQWKSVPEARIWQLKAMKPEWFEAQSEPQLP